MKPIRVTILFVIGIFSPSLAQSLQYDVNVMNADELYSDTTLTLSYRAIGAYTFSIVIFDSEKEIVHHFTGLKTHAGNVVIPAGSLDEGTYTCALEVNGRLGIRKKMKVYHRKHRPVI